MRKTLAWLGAAVVVGFAGLPASAKTEVKKNKDAVHWAHSYAAALEEAQDRGTVIFATFHIDH